jgi:hypothetical protein
LVQTAGLKWIKLKTNGDWQRFSTDNILDASEDNSFGRMVIDKERDKMDGDK